MVRSFVGRARRAYTLVEMLIVVVILGIAAALVVPAMGDTDVLRVQAAVRTIIADITYAQSEAVAHQEGRAIVFHADEGRYAVVQVVNGVVDETTGLLYETRLDQSLMGDARITQVEFGEDDVLVFDEVGAPAFGENGQPPESGKLEIEGSGQRFTVTIDGYTGRVTVARTDLP
ncbi:MAG: prepilin-type N-terminal cleavage/methylation domain-containing protein [Planctomycetota bacterium]|nr:prepilin-type N-terminal cleavage/methylation domain-containing protein [Planctomycetota bacterium]